jgi:hypothetical protein
MSNSGSEIPKQESGQLTAEELGRLAEELANTTDPAEIARLRSALVSGFYGE